MNTGGVSLPDSRALQSAHVHNTVVSQQTTYGVTAGAFMPVGDTALHILVW